MATIPEALTIASNHHQGGRLQAAAEIYQQILDAEPEHVDALHLLGMTAHQTGKLDDAVDCWRKTVDLKPEFAQAHYNLGLAYKDQGKWDEAVACWRRAAELQPDVAQTHNNLGNALRVLGKIDEAAACFRRALELTPDSPRLHYNLANALRDQGKLEEAVASYRRALELAPGYLEAFSNLGLALRQQGQLEQAIICWRQIVELKPDFAEGHYNLGVVYTDLEKFEEAIACCRKAVELKPDFAEAHNNLGNALREVGALDESMACCRRALELQPSLAEAHNNLGNALKDQGKLDEALACYRRALEQSPDLARAHCNLGNVLREQGIFAEAEDCFRTALRHNSQSALAHYGLAKLLRDKLADEDFAAQSRMLEQRDLTDSQRLLLHFGLAQVLDARGDYAAAAEHLECGNAAQLSEARRRGQEYDPQGHELAVTRMTEVCTREFFARCRGFGLDSEVPVFVVGLPRSGTTLVEQILASHSRVFGAGEIKLAYETLLALGRQGSDVLEGLRNINRDTARGLGTWHLDRLRGLEPEALRIVDKLPHNYLHLGMLTVLFPRARFIHCRRDMRDVAVSCWMTHFPEFRWANDRQHMLSRFRTYQRIMDHWRTVLPIPLLEVDYEDTVADVERTARRLVSWCGLEWEPSCLDFHQAKRPVSTASALQVRQPVYSTSVGRWKHYEQPLGSFFADLEKRAPSTHEMFFQDF